jgi:N-acetylglucosamine-6-phosphate deacetylase
METLVIRGVIVGEECASDIHLQEGKVVAVRRVGPDGRKDRRSGRARPDIGARHSFIAPTLFDIQVNGAMGINLQGNRVTPEDVLALNRFLAGWGASHWCPTVCTNSQAAMERGCRAVAEALEIREVRRAVPGIHVEGPYLSKKDGPRGAHPIQYVREPSLREFDRLMKAADGHILYMTVAPEVAGITRFIQGLVKRGVMVALGHHEGSADDVARAVEAGARVCTHLGNGLAAEINRHVNPLWPQLACDGLHGSFIADLEHLPPDTLKSFVRAKSPERTILTSDCVRLAGMPPGVYVHHSGVRSQRVEKLPSGRINLLGTKLLSGSSLMLLQGVINAARVTDLTLAQAFASASSIPGNVFGLRHRFVAPRVGNKANFVVIDIDKSEPKWRVARRAIFIAGQRKELSP